MVISTKEVLRFMREGVNRPVSFKELSRKMEINKETREAFKQLLNSMLEDGKLVKIRGNRYGLPAKMNLITGIFECHARGFGFVVPEGGGKNTGADLFIKASAKKGAMHNDRVVARKESRSRDGKTEGTIIRILERAHKSVVGEFLRYRGASVVRPTDTKITDDIIIPPRLGAGARNGDIVVAQITRWPTKDIAPWGKVTQVLGALDDPVVEVDILARKYSLSLDFPDDVLKEAQGVASEVTELERKGRVDLRRTCLFTIDGESAKDFDDAVGIQKTNAGYTLFVSIADVSHYVREGSLLDTEAFKRSTSVYLPDRCIPMLPPSLSNDICSLKPDIERLSLTAELSFDLNGVLKDLRLYRSVIKSRARLTYTEVHGLLQDGVPLGDCAEVEKGLRLMEELRVQLSARRVESGSIDFDLPEPQVIINSHGDIEDIIRSERNVAHRLIEEFMLSANKAVATEFSKKELPLLYRIHERPDMEKLNDFSAFIAGFGYHLKRMKDPSLLPPSSLQKVLKQCEGSAEEKLITHVMLRSMKRAEYSPVNSGHFGLAFADYAHFTSPIRRYPDLVVHRLVKKLINGEYTPGEQERVSVTLPAIAVQSSKLERNAMEAEREIIDLKKTQFMKDKVGQEYDGFISGVTSFGIFVELKDYFVEGLVHVTTLIDDYYHFDEVAHLLVGERNKRRFQVGDELKVLIDSVNISRRQIDMKLVDTKATGKKKTRQRKTR